MPRRGFTLIELLVVVSVVALLVSLLLPSLAGARASARSVVCLSNVRQLEVAHTMYTDDNRGYFADADLPHGGVGSARGSWITSLAPYYATAMVVRSPVDRSVEWPVSEGGRHPGLPLEAALALLQDDDPSNDPTPSQIARWTSYGLNNMVTTSKAPPPRPGAPVHNRIDLVPRPHATVHFVMMTFTGPNARTDHTHVEGWAPILGSPDDVPANAADQVQIDAHGGPPGSWESRSNYGFLDGHAATHKFNQVWRNRSAQRFWPPFAF